MKTAVGHSQIVPAIPTIREAQKFLAKHFGTTRLIAAPFLSQRTGKSVYLKLETELRQDRSRCGGRSTRWRRE